jgi:hypothetical protein
MRIFLAVLFVVAFSGSLLSGRFEVAMMVAPRRPVVQPPLEQQLKDPDPSCVLLTDQQRLQTPGCMTGDPTR